MASKSPPKLRLFATFVACFLLTTGLAALPARASSSVFERNLIVNGDADAGNASPDGAPEAIPGWDRHGTNFVVVDYDGTGAAPGGGIFAWPSSSGGPPDHGANLFTGGIRAGNAGSAACATDSVNVSCATQTVDVSQGASLIDAGGVTFDLSGWLGGFQIQLDHAVLTATFRSGGGKTLDSAQIGPVTADDRNDENPDTADTKLLPRSASGTVPEGTRSIRLRLDMTSFATEYNDGYADSLSLVLHTKPGGPFAWGRNEDGAGGGGQIGDGTTTSRNAPVAVSGLTGISSMAGGYFHSLWLKSDGTVYASGRDNEGQLGNGTDTSSSTTPAQVPGLSGIVTVAAAGTQSMALKSDGTIYGWGAMPGLNTSSPTQVVLPNGVKATAIAAGVNHSLALGDDGHVYAWGDNTYGQLGDGTNTPASSESPVKVSELPRVASISAGQFHSVALKRVGTDVKPTIVAWGLNNHGQLGDNTTTDRNTPVTADITVVSIPENPPTIAAIDAGDNHTLALLSDGTVYYTGSDGADPVVDEYAHKAGISTAIGITGGEAASFVLLENRTVQAWGDNACGQLGVGLAGGPCTGTFEASPIVTPTEVSGLSGVSVVEAGHLTNYAVTGPEVAPASEIANVSLTVADGESPPGPALTTGPGVSEALLSKIPLTDIPESVPAGPDDAPVGKSPVGKSPVGKSPVGKSPVGKSPVGKSPVGKSPVGKSPVGKSPVGKSPVGKSPVGKSPLSAFVLLRPGGWPEILAHTSGLVGATPQSVTWDQLLNDASALDAPEDCTLTELNPDPNTCPSDPAPLTLDEIVWSTSPIANLSFLSLLLGDVTWNDVSNTRPASGTNTVDGWCEEWALMGQPLCSSASDPRLSQPIFESEANGLPPYLTSLPTKHVSDIAEAARPTTLFWGVTLIDLNVNGSFLKKVKIADIPLATRGNVVDCGETSPVNCDTDTLGDAYDATDLDSPTPPTPFLNSGTFADLGTPVLGDRSLASIEIAFLDPRAISWEDVPLEGVQWETFAEDQPTNFIQYHLDFDVDCRDSADLEASVDLPSGFRYRPDSSALFIGGAESEPSVGNPEASETGDATWDLTEFECTGIAAKHYSLRFEVMPGFKKGTFTSDASVRSATAAAVSVDDKAPVTVDDAFSGNGTTETATAVSTNSLLVVHPTGDPQYFTFTADPGDQVQVSLSHQSHDGDIVLYAPAGTSGESFLSANDPQPLSFGKNPLDDPVLNEATDVLPPESLQDVEIVPGLPVAGISNFRGTEVDAVTTTVPDDGGTVTYTLQLDWFNDDVGPEPAVATIRSFDPVDLPECETRTDVFPGAPAAATTPAVASSVNTLLLFHEQRTVDMFGAAAAADIESSLQALATSTTIPGVNAEIVYLDSFGAVNTAFGAADADPCSPATNNSVVKAINDAVETLGTATNGELSNVRNVVLVGDDYLIPHARLLDETTEGNESEFTGDTFFGPETNQLGGAFARGYFLSDAPYGTRTPVSLLGETVYLPQWAVGRLGGSGLTIENAIDAFVASGGLADPRTTITPPRTNRTALVTDYDGFSDGGLLAFNELESQVGAGNAEHLTGAWTRQNYMDHVGASDPPDVIVQNGHHDQYRMLPGAFDGASFQPTDLFTTQDTAGGPSMEQRVVLSIGCHFGLDFPAEIGTGTDPRLNYWAKAYFDQGASVLVGNLGYGYFDTSTAAFDERLMADFVRHLDEFPTTGEALRQAEVKYFTTMASFTAYDRKVLQQTIMWGFPMTRMPGAPAPAAATLEAASASSASLATDPVSGLPSTTVTITPTFNKIPEDGTTPQYYEADDGTQATHPYPILPLVSEALPSGSIAKGAVPLSLEYEDDAPFTAAFANATIDSSAIESAPAFEVGGYPSTLASIGTAVGPDGSFVQRLNVTPGVFRPTDNPPDSSPDSPALGLFRKFTNSTWLVTYGSPDGNTAGPTISQTEAIEVSGNTAFVVDVDHPSGIARVFVQVFRDDGTGTVDRVELSHSGGTRWTGGTTGTDIFEYWVFAISNAGTSASSTNKAVGYVPLPPPPAPDPQGDVTLTTNPASPGDDGWFSGPVDVTVTPDDHRISIDGDEPPDTTTRTVTGDGIHVVDAVAPDGSIVGSIVVPIDGTSPTITFITPPDGAPATYVRNQDVNEDYECIDAGSGVDSCTDNNPGTKVDTSTVGVHTFTVTAQDIAGNPPTTLSVQYCVVSSGTPSFCGWFDPIENPPTINPVNAGSAVPMKWRLYAADGTQRTSLTAVKSITLQRFDCSTGKNVGRAITLSKATLKYDDGRQQYNYGFSTEQGWRGTCGRVTIAFDDRTSRFALFRFT